MKLLTKIAEVIFGKKITSLETLPHVALNGFNNLREAFGTSKLFYDETKGMIQCICLLDSDYYPRDMIKKRCDEASANHLKLHIWKRKEIENYLLEPEVLFRISKQSQEKYDVFMKELEEVADEFRNRVFDQYAEHILKYKKIDISSANSEAREYMKNNWTGLKNKLSMVGGKEFVKCLNK